MSGREATTAPTGDHRRHSISAKIIFLVFLCTFSTALVISWIAIHATHGQVREEIERGFPAALERSRGALLPWLGEGVESLRAQRARHPAGQRSPAWLATFAAESLHFDAVGLVDAGGVWLAATPELAASVAGPRPASGSAWITLEGPDGAAPAAAIPLDANDLRSPFLVGRYDRPALRGLLERERQGTPGALMLTDAGGRVLAAAGAGSGDATQARHALAQLDSGSPGAIHEYASDAGAHVLGAVLPVGDAKDWHLVVQATFSTAFEPTRIFVMDLLIILVFIAFAYRITTRMLRPIEQLSEGARQASRGELGLAISDPGTHDEIGLLTRSFNEMMAKLKQSQHDLQQANRQLTAQNEELQRANEVLSQLSITDGLTKLHNHRYFQERLTREIKRQSRSNEPLSMLLVDLDDFKALNDRLGHASGDELLVRVASIMATTVRESDLLARYGGEEFVVLATDTEVEGAVALAEKIRLAVEQTPHIVDDSLRPVRITVSVGVAQYRGNRRLFFESADRALYRAKGEGKNCVVADDVS
jgi:diguanylate cyclase (GGDEF)-like protein